MTTSPEHPTSKKKPLVSIIIPVFNDEDYVARAIKTAINQSLKDIEIICVDDQSTDNTAQIIREFVKKDARIELIQHQINASAFQARYTGIKAARADYILFLDGDDELHSDAAKLTYSQARRSKSDIVGFGSKIVRKDGSTSRDFEDSIQPIHKMLTGSQIVLGLFEPNKPAQGSMWRYLFSKKLLKTAYSYFPEGHRLYRTNDLPISFLAASLAKKYTSIKNRLYTYHFYAGESGNVGFDINKFKFYTQAVESINLLRAAIDTDNFSDAVKESYYSARLFVISNIIRQIENNLPAAYHEEAIRILLSKVGLDEVTYSVANFIPEALDKIRKHLPKIKTVTSKNVALYTNNLNAGGVQGVVISQAKYLEDAGFNVTIILLNDNDIVFNIPRGVKVEVVEKGPIYTRLKSFRSILVTNKIDAIIDHNILYNFSWPFFNLIAKSLGIKTLAWIHSFSLRPMVEGNTNGKFLNDNISLIDDLVVLSKADVSYWKALGHKNVFYIPNPPSPLLLENHEVIKPKDAPKIHLNIVWFGRLQEATKKVYSLIDIAAELRKLTDEFTLTIIGPDSNDLKVWQVKDRVRKYNLEDHVVITGPKFSNDLISELKKADLHICTSIIEGYQLTLTEAQSYALPVVMYELPWLATLENNGGVIQTPQKDPAKAAQEIYTIFTDKLLYKKLSRKSLEASKSYLSYDFAKLYTQLLQHKLPEEFSPKINTQHMGMFAKWTQFYLAELIEGGSSLSSSDVLRRKDAEIEALKNSKAMKVGNLIARPARIAKGLKHKLAKHLKKA